MKWFLGETNAHVFFKNQLHVIHETCDWSAKIEFVRTPLIWFNGLRTLNEMIIRRNKCTRVLLRSFTCYDETCVSSAKIEFIRIIFKWFSGLGRLNEVIFRQNIWTRVLQKSIACYARNFCWKYKNRIPSNPIHMI